MLIAKKELILPAKLETAARLMFSNPDYIAFGNSVSIARRCQVSTSTLSRLAPRLGFRSFKEMQNCFRKDILDRKGSGNGLTKQRLDCQSLKLRFTSP
ncbi:MurR/RpiR family transcriptional regulator [Mesorhizobium sp. B4-1-3]|uniref:MurR/RpiR family transcriptional regulator n=1 Tax=Mesorhizobium sp. B4-1-3 TaxID=2589889 RepID=UPI0015E35E3B|nr:MurR/RpiR family transcriptional regulator [Mesorhizobium sp. B4-1-3]